MKDFDMVGYTMEVVYHGGGIEIIPPWIYQDCNGTMSMIFETRSRIG
jgi:hypothetical protein